MKNYNEDDPIQDVSKKSIFSRLNSFENDYEYKFEKEMEEYEKQKSQNTVKEQKNKNKNSISAGEFIAIAILPIIIISIVEMAITYTIHFNKVKDNKNVSNNENTKIEETYEDDGTLDSIYMAKLEKITFDGVGSIPALYKYNKNVVANWCEYTYSDDRFGTREGISTLEINYNEIPIEIRTKYSEHLQKAEFSFEGVFGEDPVFLKEMDNEYSLFVVISEYRIIYGACHGDYTNIFY